MPVDNRLEGRMQYTSQQEAEAAQAWVAEWVGGHQQEVRSQVTNDIAVLDPPHEEGCTHELTLVVHLRTDTSEVVETQYQPAFEQAIYFGGTATAGCSSWFGALSE